MNDTDCESGSGMEVYQLEFRDCLMQPIGVNITRPINTEDIVTGDINGADLFEIHNPLAEPVFLTVTLTESSLLPSSVNSRLAAGTVTVQSALRGSGLFITVAGDLVFVTNVILNFRATITNSMMLETDSCTFTVAMTVKERDNCTETSSLPLVQDFDLAQQLRVYNAITLTANIPVASVSPQIITIIM